jgi:hypothetical protein
MHRETQSSHRKPAHIDRNLRRAIDSRPVSECSIAARNARQSRCQAPFRKTKGQSNKTSDDERGAPWSLSCGTPAAIRRGDALMEMASRTRTLSDSRPAEE